jgi:hypothetical protein
MQELDSEELYQTIKEQIKNQKDLENSLIYKNTLSQEYIYTQEEIYCAKKFISFDINNLNNWVSASFESNLDEKKSILTPEITGSWGSAAKAEKKVGVNITNSIFLSNEGIIYKLVNNTLKSTVILKGESEYWIFLHSKGKFDENTIVIFFSKVEFSEAVFMSLGLFIKENNGEEKDEDKESDKYCFRIFHTMQLVRSYKKNETNNNKYDNNDSCMIKISVTDEGREEIRVSAWINEGDAENKLVGRFCNQVAVKKEENEEIRPTSSFEINKNNYKIMIAGSGHYCKITQFSCETNFKEECKPGFSNCNCCLII